MKELFVISAVALAGITPWLVTAGDRRDTSPMWRGMWEILGPIALLLGLALGVAIACGGAS
jgi:hypothetical protein